MKLGPSSAPVKGIEISNVVSGNIDVPLSECGPTTNEVALPCRVRDRIARQGRVGHRAHVDGRARSALRISRRGAGRARPLAHALGRYACPQSDEASVCGQVCRGARIYGRCPPSRFVITHSASGRSGSKTSSRSQVPPTDRCIGRMVRAQWDEVHVRLVEPSTGMLLREHRVADRGRHRMRPDQRRLELAAKLTRGSVTR